MKWRMKQGTVSVLVGCHSPIHSILVLLAWRKLYGQWPVWWQVVCIFLHDIGHWGLDYLDDYEQKKKHWIAGANLAGKWYGYKGFVLVAGHCQHSGRKLSKLYKADKYSWHLAPTWWLWLNNIFEPQLMINCESNVDAIRKFKITVKESIESGTYSSTHQMYLDRLEGRE